MPRARLSELWTIGHSTRPVAELLALLRTHGIVSLVDVRTIPLSRRNPQFNQEALKASAETAGLRYRHAPALGGLRKSRPDSINLGWKNASFRGYADYMQTDEFWRALDELLAAAAEAPTAILCAEAVPWRCHRSLIADAVTSEGKGWTVRHILSAAPAHPHHMTPFARQQGSRLVYPPPPPQEPDSSDPGPRLF